MLGRFNDDHSVMEEPPASAYAAGAAGAGLAWRKRVPLLAAVERWVAVL